jgi:DNA processing protein
LISEQAPDTPPRAGLFPVRNRLIAALCDRLIVIEGTHHSGSLITANQALELGKDIWAVPGSPLSPLSSGPNRLIRDGAQPFTEPED